MSGTVLPFQSGVHDTVDALLPWYVNGTLTGNKFDLVRLHLAECAACRDEAEWLGKLFAACKEAEALPEMASDLARLRTRAHARAQAKPASAHARRSWRDAPWTRWSLAASLVIGLTCGAWVLHDGGEGALYRTLGSAPSAARHAGSLIVAFDPATTEAEIRRILDRAEARIVDGPTQTNAFVLEVPPQREAFALAALRAEHVVTFDEQLGSRGP